MSLFKVHTNTKAKNTLKYKTIEQDLNIDQRTGLRTYKTIMLAIYRSKQLYPEKLRIVEFYDCQNNVLLVFLTNNFEVSAFELAN